VKVPGSSGEEELGQYQARSDPAAQLFGKVGGLGYYRRCLWNFALSGLRNGDIEGLFSSSLVGPPLIGISRARPRVPANASNYSLRLREASMAAECTNSIGRAACTVGCEYRLMRVASH